MTGAKRKNKGIAMKLWEKEYRLNKQVEDFTVGDDYILDRKLIKYDALVSMPACHFVADRKSSLCRDINFD